VKLEATLLLSSRRVDSLTWSTLSFSILNQPQEASRTGSVGLIGDDLLPKQRITYVAHVPIAALFFFLSETAGLASFHLTERCGNRAWHGLQSSQDGRRAPPRRGKGSGEPTCDRCLAAQDAERLIGAWNERQAMLTLSHLTVSMSGVGSLKCYATGSIEKAC
jgi:hypothetical protein